MKLTIAAVGRLKAGPLQDLAAEYTRAADNFGRKIGLGPLSVIELIESRASSATLRRDDESERLLAAVGGKAGRAVALSEDGTAMASTTFALWLSRQRDAGTDRVFFLIGGPDGHGQAIRTAADLLLSLGPMTLPHGLARVVLLEQLYRAATVLAGHPYHRA